MMGDNKMWMMKKILVTLLKLCFLTLFVPFIATPTRITRNTKTLTDNIFYNKPLNDIMSGNLSSIISDHLIHFLTELSNLTKKSSQMIYRERCYKNFDKFQLRANLIKVNWDSFCNNPNPNATLEHFLKIIQKLLDKHAPYKNIKHPKYQLETKPLITPGLADSIKVRINFTKVSARKKIKKINK